MLLAIDTATSNLSLALHDGALLLAESTLLAERRHSALLAPLIKQIMAGAQVSMSDLKALAVSVGPGSYTGVRIGVALAKGMAAAGSLPLVPITSLETVAAATRPERAGRALIATVASGRERVIWAEYNWVADDWRERRAPGISSWHGLTAAITGPILLSGELSAAGLSALNEAREAGADIKALSASDRLRRAGTLAEIAWDRLRAADRIGAFPADQVRPIYLQGPG